MLFREVLLGNPQFPDSWALFQRALLINGLYYGRDGFDQACDHLLGPGWHLWSYHASDGHIPPGYAIVSQHRELVVVIKGTTNLQQWTPHILGSWAQEFPMPSGKVYVHIGFHWPIRDIIWPIVKTALDNPPPGGWEKVRVMGHSYGGGCAAVLKSYLADYGVGPITEVVTFGAPRAWAGQLNASRLTPTHLRVEGPDDMVTHLPPPAGSLRAIISTAGSYGLGATGLGFLLRFVGGQVVKAPFDIPFFRHYGDRVDLNYNGSLNYLPGEQAPNGGVTIPINRPRSGHVMDDFYVPFLLLGMEKSAPLPEEQRALIDKMSDIQALPAAPDPSITLLQFIGRQVNAADVTTNYPGYLTMTPEQLADADQYFFLTAQPTNPASIGAAFGGKDMAWKFTAFISWGDYGRSVSIHKTGADSILSARNEGMAWINKYVAMFGHVAGGVPLVNGLCFGAPGNPIVEWLRVSDPLQPRVSQRFRVIGRNGGGYNTNESGYEADAPWVGLSLTVMATAAGRTTRDVVSVLGQPDDVCKSGLYNASAMVSGTAAFNTQLTRYLAYILPSDKGASGFGTMGRDYATYPDRDVTGFALGSDGFTHITCPLGAFADGSYIRITGSKVPYYNREWKVWHAVDGTYGLYGSRPAQAAMPNSAKAYQTRTPLGVKLQVFYPYAERAGSFSIADRAFVSKRNPTAKYSPLASRRKRRTPAK